MPVTDPAVGEPFCFALPAVRSCEEIGVGISSPKSRTSALPARAPYSSVTSRLA